MGRRRRACRLAIPRPPRRHHLRRPDEGGPQGRGRGDRPRLALRFLETGVSPITVAQASPTSVKKATRSKSAGPPPRASQAGRLEVARDWPLPVPDALGPVLPSVQTEQTDAPTAFRDPDRPGDRREAAGRGAPLVRPDAAPPPAIGLVPPRVGPRRPRRGGRGRLAPRPGDRDLSGRARRGPPDGPAVRLRVCRPLPETPPADPRRDQPVDRVGQAPRLDPRDLPESPAFLEILERMDGRPILQSTRLKRK